MSYGNHLLLLPHKIISKKNFPNFSRLSSKRKYGKQQKLLQIIKEFGLPIKRTLKKTFQREKTEIYRGLNKMYYSTNLRNSGMYWYYDLFFIPEYGHMLTEIRWFHIVKERKCFRITWFFEASLYVRKKKSTGTFHLTLS